MANMTGVVPALYNTFSTQLAEKKRARELESERQRRKQELLRMFGALGFQNIPPEGVSQDTAPMIMQQKMAQQGQDAQMARVKEDNNAKVQADQQKKLDKADEERLKVNMIRGNILNYDPNFEKNHYPIRTLADAEDAQTIVKYDRERIEYEHNQGVATDQNIRQNKATRPPDKPPRTNVSQLNYTQKMLARKYRSYITEREYNKDYTNPENVYDALPPEIQDQWDAEQATQTGGTGTPPPQPGGGMPAFMQPGYQPPTGGGQQVSPNQSANNGKLIGMDRISGKKVYQLPNGSYVDENGNPMQAR